MTLLLLQINSVPIFQLMLINQIILYKYYQCPHALMYISKGILVWFVVSSIIVFIDAFYVLMRPQTLPGGKYHAFFAPYELYVKYDTLYGKNDNSFVKIQSWLNIFQAIMCLIGVVLTISSCKIKKLIGAIICLVASTMVFWKTVMFVWYDRDFLTPDALNFTPESILCYYFPSSFWLVFPIICIWTIGKSFVRIHGGASKEKQKNH